MSVLEEQEKLKLQLLSLENDRNMVTELIKQARKALDDSVTINGDALAKAANEKRVSDWNNRELEPVDQDWLDELKKKNIEFMKSQNGVWWESLDDRNNPVPFPIVVSKSSFGDRQTMAHVLVSIGIFPSLSEAKKNGGWDKKPIVLGEIKAKKKRILIKE